MRERHTQTDRLTETERVKLSYCTQDQYLFTWCIFVYYSLFPHFSITPKCSDDNDENDNSQLLVITQSFDDIVYLRNKS